MKKSYATTELTTPSTILPLPFNNQHHQSKNIYNIYFLFVTQRFINILYDRQYDKENKQPIKNKINMSCWKIFSHIMGHKILTNSRAEGHKKPRSVVWITLRLCPSWTHWQTWTNDRSTGGRLLRIFSSSSIIILSSFVTTNWVTPARTPSDINLQVILMLRTWVLRVLVRYELTLFCKL